MNEIVWTLGATLDLQEIYSEIGDVPGDHLLRRIDSALTLLTIFPEQGPIYLGTLRRLLVGRGRRYGLFFVIEGSRIIISAVADLRQDPEHLAAMLRKRTNN